MCADSKEADDPFSSIRRESEARQASHLCKCTSAPLQNQMWKRRQTNTHKTIWEKLWLKSPDYENCHNLNLCSRPLSKGHRWRNYERVSWLGCLLDGIRNPESDGKSCKFWFINLQPTTLHPNHIQMEGFLWRHLCLSSWFKFQHYIHRSKDEKEASSDSLLSSLSSFFFLSRQKFGTKNWARRKWEITFKTL